MSNISDILKSVGGVYKLNYAKKEGAKIIKKCI